MDRCGVGIEETSRWGDEVEAKQSLRCVVEWLGVWMKLGEKVSEKRGLVAYKGSHGLASLTQFH
jgi:hypothetical protein